MADKKSESLEKVGIVTRSLSLSQHLGSYWVPSLSGLGCDMRIRDNTRRYTTGCFYIVKLLHPKLCGFFNPGSSSYWGKVTVRNVCSVRAKPPYIGTAPFFNAPCRYLGLFRLISAANSASTAADRIAYCAHSISRQ